MAIRPKLNRVWTSNNSVARRDPGDAKYLKGWVAEIPTYQVLNYLQYKIDTTMLAQAERGIFEWGSDVSYGVGSLAWDETNKTIYVCTVASPNKSLRPSENSAQWSPSAIQVSRANYDSIVSAINTHIADVTTNPHRVTAAQIGAYNKSELDNIVANYRAMVQAHVTDYNNPHKLTATQVGAVPATGGEYTGEVTFTTVYLNDSKTAQIVNDGGLYLRNGSYYLGINGTTGDAETGTAASKSRIVTELNFPDVKAAQEPGYAVPLESFQMGLINSINIQRGTGTASTPVGEPTYDPDTGMMGVNNVKFKLAASDVVRLPSNGEFTICFDYMHTFLPERSDWSLVAGTDFARVLIRKNGVMAMYIATSEAQTVYASLAIPTELSGTIIRIVGSYDGTTYRLYVNGVLTNSQAGLPPTGSSRPIIYIPKYPDTVRIRNFRLWPSRLSNRQISTL